MRKMRKQFPRIAIAAAITAILAQFLMAYKAQAVGRPVGAQIACTPASTAPGILDTCFGINGTGLVITTINPNNIAEDIAIQSDGKLVVACNAKSPSGTGTDPYTARYNPDGTLDQTFGTGGIVGVAFTAAGDTEIAKSVAIQPTDGKIVIAGEALVKRSTYGFAVFRLNTDGTLDNTFGSGGKVQIAFSSDASAKAMALQADGKIVLAGGQGSDIALARLNSNGTLDGSFGSGGKVTVVAGKGTTLDARAVAIQVINGQERIVAAGYRSPSKGSWDFALVRLMPNGTLDGTFGSGGKVYTDFFGYSDVVQTLAISGTSITAGGITNRDGTRAGTDFGLAKYTADGTLDATFGVGGRVTTDILSWQNYIDDMVIQPDGKIVATGIAAPDNSSGDFAVVRYNADGSLDGAFGQGGIVLTDFYGQRDDPTGGLALQADGKIVVAGLANSAAYVALARYMP